MRTEMKKNRYFSMIDGWLTEQASMNMVNEIRGKTMDVGTIEELIDDSHCIVSTAYNSNYYVSICSFVDKDQLEPGSTVLLHRNVGSMSGLARSARISTRFQPLTSRLVA